MPAVFGVEIEVYGRRGGSGGHTGGVQVFDKSGDMSIIRAEVIEQRMRFIQRDAKDHGPVGFWVFWWTASFRERFSGIGSVNGAKGTFGRVESHGLLLLGLREDVRKVVWNFG